MKLFRVRSAFTDADTLYYAAENITDAARGFGKEYPDVREFSIDEVASVAIVTISADGCSLEVR